MARTREQAIEYWERKLQGCLFRAYHTKETDPAQLFRMETQDAQLLRLILEEMFPLKPEPANGQPSQAKKATP